MNYKSNIKNSFKKFKLDIIHEMVEQDQAELWTVQVNDNNYKIKAIKTNNKNATLQLVNSEIVLKYPYFLKKEFLMEFIKKYLNAKGKQINNKMNNLLIDYENNFIFILGNKYKMSINEKNNIITINIINLKIFNFKKNENFDYKKMFIVILKNYLELYLKTRQSHFEALMEIPSHKWSIREKSTNWAANWVNKMHIIYNPKLAHYESRIIDYVIVHELAHHMYPNHSQKFWYLVEKYIPNYKDIRLSLNIHEVVLE